jgi:FkbM family methyltransferase
MIFDIGANSGSYSKEYTKNGFKVIAVEPQKQLCNRITEEQPDTIVINALVGRSPEPLDFFICNADTLSTSSIDWMTKGRFANQYSWQYAGKIPCISLDQLIQKYGIPFYIKIDVEGSEVDVLSSLTKKADCLLSFEWVEEFKQNAMDAIDYLKSIGYTQFWISNHPRGNVLKIEQIKNHIDMQFYDIVNFEQILLSNIDSLPGNPSWGDVYVR